MTDDEIKALRAGDIVYRVNRWYDMNAADRYHVLEFRFASKRVTEDQIKRDRATIVLEAAPHGSVKHVSFSMLRGFYKTPREAVDAFHTRTIADDEAEALKYARAA